MRMEAEKKSAEYEERLRCLERDKGNQFHDDA